MFPFSRKMMHSLEAILYIALHHSVRPINGKLLADRQNLPPRYLERVLQTCVHEGILRSIRGPRGGYVLARERRRITLAEICRLLSAADAEETAGGKPTPIGDYVIMPVFSDATKALYAHLEKTTLASLCENVYDRRMVLDHENARAARQSRQDFNI